MKSIKSYFINIVIICVISFLSVCLVLQGDFTQIKSMISEISIYALGILAFLGLCPYVVEALILKKFSNLYLPSYSLKDGFVNAMTGAFFSGITPFSSGGQFAQAFVFKNQGITYTNSTGILLMHFIIYQICLVIYTLMIMLVKYKELSSYYNGFLSLAMLGFLCNTIVIVCLLLGAVSYKFQHFLTNYVLKLGYRFRIVKNYAYTKKKLENYLVDFHRELKVIQRHPKEMISISLLFILKLTMLYSLPYIIFLAMGHPLSSDVFFDCFAICAFIYLITAFIPIPGASGGSEGTYILLFTSLVGSVLAKSSMLVWRFITYYFTIFLGCIIFMVYTNIKHESKKGEKGR